MKFDKTQFNWDGLYLMYRGLESGEMHFVARFKRKGDRTGFVEFLRKNFTVEEYFQELVLNKKAPVEILEAKGYVSATVKKVLASAGYEPTLAGKRQYLKDQSERWAASMRA